MSDLTLPSGATVTLRAPKDVPEYLRRPVTKAFMQMQRLNDTEAEAAEAAAAADADAASDAPALSKAERRALRDEQVAALEEALDFSSNLNDLVAVALIEAWSLPREVSVESIQQLAGQDYDALRNEVAPMLLELIPDFGPDPEPETPSQP